MKDGCPNGFPESRWLSSVKCDRGVLGQELPAAAGEQKFSSLRSGSDAVAVFQRK